MEEESKKEWRNNILEKVQGYKADIYLVGDVLAEVNFLLTQTAEEARKEERERVIKEIFEEADYQYRAAYIGEREGVRRIIEKIKSLKEK